MENDRLQPTTTKLILEKWSKMNIHALACEIFAPRQMFSDLKTDALIFDLNYFLELVPFSSG